MIGTGIGMLIAGLATGTAGVYGAHAQGRATRDASQAQVDAANRAAELEKQAADDALKFQREEATRAAASSEAARRGNYDQWRAREGRLGTLGGMVGLGPRDIPDYVPDPSASGGGPPGASGGAPSGPAPAIDASKGDIAGQVSAYFKSRGVSDQETPYWVQKWGEFGAKDPAYFNSRLADADVFRGGRSATPPQSAPRSSTPYTGQTIGSFAQRTTPRLPLTAPLEAPQVVYDPNSLAGYATGGY